METFELVNLEGRQWMKIKEDQAFELVLDSFEYYAPIYDKEVTAKNVVVQAGGYCGIFPRLLGEAFKTVYTFEPDYANFFCLSHNCAAPNIIKAQGALGNEHGMISVHRQINHNRGMNKVIKYASSNIPVYRIDDLQLTDCNLIQLDTEGYEYYILVGAKYTIQRFKPLISVEDTTEHIEDFLFPMGYTKLTTIDRDTFYKCEH
jgi:FkbM family methyltransferase